jgi:predicted homoserine dehydrogenase-like protein
MFHQLQAREAAGKPIQVAVIGAGTFGTQIVAQICRMPGMRVAVVGELNAKRALLALGHGGKDPQRCPEVDRPGAVNDAIRDDTPAVTGNVDAIFQSEVDVVIEATGNVHAGARHAFGAIEAHKHVVMVTVEADVVIGHLLKQRADAAGVIYSMAYGDEPAVAYELWDHARTLGFRVVACGKGTRFLPSFRKFNPDDVPARYGFTGKDYNAQMFGSFLDGTKHNIEMAALANATGLVPDVRGLHFPSADLRTLPDVLCARDKGGILEQEGVVGAISAIHPDETPIERNLRGGVFAVVDAPGDFYRSSLASYGDIIGVMIGKRSGYDLFYRPHHLIGHEMPVTVARMMLYGHDCDAPVTKTAEVIAQAKRPLRAGEILDGEGGFTVYGLIERATVAKEQNLVPMGLTHGAKTLRAIAEDEPITFDNVAVADSFACKLWRNAEK